MLLTLALWVKDLKVFDFNFCFSMSNAAETPTVEMYSLALEHKRITKVLNPRSGDLIGCCIHSSRPNVFGGDNYMPNIDVQKLLSSKF